MSPMMTLLAALVLAAVPLPEQIAPFEPAWAALILIYWSLASSRGISFVAAFCTGLGLDALTGSLLGQHALALLLLVYVCRKFYLQLRAFPVSQLALFVAALLGVYQFVLFWIDGAVGRTVPAIESWAPIVSGSVLWIFIWSAFDRGRERASARL